MLDEVIRMRCLLIDKINDYADRDETLFGTPTKTIFDDMLQFYQSGSYEKLKPNAKSKGQTTILTKRISVLSSSSMLKKTNANNSPFDKSRNS